MGFDVEDNEKRLLEDDVGVLRELGVVIPVIGEPRSMAANVARGVELMMRWRVEEVSGVESVSAWLDGDCSV